MLYLYLYPLYYLYKSVNVNYLYLFFIYFKLLSIAISLYLYICNLFFYSQHFIRCKSTTYITNCYGMCYNNKTYYNYI